MRFAVPVLTFLVQVAILSPLVGTAGITYDYGGTAEENSQIISEMQKVQAGSFGGQLNALNEVLRINPHNRPALSLRASLLLSDGQVAKAKQDIDVLVNKFPDYPDSRPLEARYGFVTDSRDIRVAAIEHMIDDHLTSVPYARGYSREVLGAELREAQGRMLEAEKIYEDLSRTDPATFAIFRTSYATLHIRAGKYKEVIDKLKGVQDLDLRLCVSQSLWAIGDFGTALVTISGKIPTVKPEDGRVRQLAVMTHCLTHGKNAVSDEERANSDEQIKMLAQVVDGKDLHNWDIVIACISGRLSDDEASQKIEIVLKSAPQLEWALWSAVAIGIKSEKEGARLLKSLPQRSIQKQILENHLKTK